MKKTRILLADDDRVILTTLAEGLERSDYEVIKANDGKEALELCLSEKPDLAVLDLRMPELTGIEVAKNLGQQSEIPFIFLTAYADQDYVDQAISEGSYAYLVKPIDVNQLKPVIESALGRANKFKKLKLTNEQLDQALQQDRSFNVAIGLIMERYKLSEKKAFEALRKYARSNHCKMSDLTKDVIESAEMLNKINTL